MRNSYKKRKPFEERFWSKVEKRGPDDCWLWTAARDKRGYGRFPLGREVLAHRWAFTLEKSDIPEGLILAKCRKALVEKQQVGFLTIKTPNPSIGDRNNRSALDACETRWLDCHDRVGPRLPAIFSPIGELRLVKGAVFHFDSEGIFGPGQRAA